MGTPTRKSKIDLWAWPERNENSCFTWKEFSLSRKKRKKQSPTIVSCKKGLACLDLICAVQLLPQTVLADDSAVQVNPADSRCTD